MNLYFNGTCDNRISRIDFTSLCLKTKDDSDIDVSMDETDIAVENGKISVRMKGIAFDNEYANGRGNLLENGTLVVNLAIDEADGRFFEDEKAWTKEDQAFYETLLHSVQLKKCNRRGCNPKRSESIRDPSDSGARIRLYGGLQRWYRVQMDRNP